MRRTPTGIPVSIALALASTAAMASPGTPDLERFLLGRGDPLGGWSWVEEAPIDVDTDADFQRWGVRAQRARHYTRATRDRVQVCSIEIWAFLDEARARAAESQLDYPHWEFERHGDLVVLLRGVTRVRGARAQRGVFPDCRSLRDRVSERIRSLKTREP
jgi:hypothetical protein